MIEWIYNHPFYLVVGLTIILQCGYHWQTLKVVKHNKHLKDIQKCKQNKEKQIGKVR